MTWRYRFVFLGLVCLFLLVVARLFYWQVVKAQELSLLGQQQYGTTLTLTPQRGEIETSDGFPIAANKLSYLVFANPKEIQNKEAVSTILASTLKLDIASVSASLALDKFWVPIQSGVDVKTKQQLESINLPGVGFDNQYQRFYPEASMAAQLLGFVGKDSAGNDKGYFGLEGFYDRLLSGKAGQAVEVHDAFGRPILAEMNQSSGETDGANLILNIDRSIQFLVEQKLKDGVEQYGATSGMVGIMNPQTGAILAMAAYPNFDPRSYQDYTNDLYKNPFISDLYEPGSTFKPLVMSGALDAKLVTPDTKCNACAGPVSVGGYQLETWDNKYFPNTNMIDVIQHSDNTGMVFVTQKLGLDGMINYLGKFGIGDSTNIDLQGEVSASLKPKSQWYAVDLATTGFGQGISITPIELLDATAAIANEGIRMEPQVVAAVRDADGNTTQIQPKALDAPINAETAKVMTQIMVNAVNKGEASWARLKGYSIAGKTGTASIPVSGHYDPTQTIASFVGFAPSDNPKFVMLVILNRPTASIYGADTAAPIFFDIAQSLLRYYGIPPEGN
ncbi:MAG TPA: penicillin-binding protein 2 [Patescibacteria group bacterium]|jgi:cell division protein FtsI/penicillin-binding protein 2|nr:penicillin-binding protein 2 [Patescibacteria group bacterium]